MRKKTVIVTDLNGVWLEKDRKKYLELTDAFFEKFSIDRKTVKKIDEKIFPRLARLARKGRMSYRELIEEYFKSTGRKDYRRLAKEFIRFEKSITKKYFRVKPDAKNVLFSLRKTGSPLICVSDSLFSVRRLRGILKELGIDRFFDGVYTSSHLKSEKPEAFEVLELKLNLRKKPVIFIGHDDDEIIGARNRGYVTIGINSENSDFRVSDLSEIPGVVSRISGGPGGI